MTRILFAIAFLLSSYVCTTAGAAPLIAFERGSGIWVANLDGTEAKKITTGSAPDLSPDGTRVAFHTNTSNDKDFKRQIAVADLATKKVTVFKKEIPSDNCQRALFSPNGAHILFSIWTDSDWHLALINADGSGFRYVKKAAPKGNSFWSACWAPDGQSIYAQNLDKLCQLALDGTELKSSTVRSLFPKGSFSSGSHFAVSADGKTLLMDVDMEDEEANLPDWDGPPPSLWTLDIASQKSTRLTPKGVLASHPCWLDADEILFTSQASGEKQPSIYRMSLPGKERKVFLKNASTPSVSR